MGRWRRLSSALERSARPDAQGAERGAVTLIIAVVVVVLMLSAAFTIDLGLQRVARADAQALADVVAMDLSRELDGRSVDQLLPVMATESAASLARNESVIGDIEPQLEIELGIVQPDGDFVPIATGVPTAVRVSADVAVAMAFGGFTGHDQGEAERQAVSQAASGACFRLGSFAAAIATGDSAVAGVFEALMADPDALGANLSAVGYQGLVTTYVNIADLAVEMGFGTVDALLSQGNVSVANLISASARALDTEGKSAAEIATAAGILGAIAARIQADTTANIGELLDVGGGAAATSKINALDLVGGAGLAASTESTIANQNNLLHTGVKWSEPHTSQGDIELSVIEPPRQACGPIGSANASTGQLELATTIGFNLPNKILGLDLSAIDHAGTQTQVTIGATLAGAQARLTGMRCGPVEEIRTVVDTRLTRVAISMPFRMRGSIDAAGILPTNLFPPLTPTRLVGLDLDLQFLHAATLETVASPGTGETTYAVPPHDYTDPQPSAGAAGLVAVQQPSLQLSATSRAWITVSGVRTVAVNISVLNLSSILNAITTSVVGESTFAVVENVNEAIVPLSKLLGMRFAGADLYGVPRPLCGLPRLVG